MACGSCISICLSTHLANSNEVFSFFIAMEGDFSSSLEIPDKFAKRIKWRKCKDAILQGPSGHMWHVNLCCIDSSASFTYGWYNFVFDNGVAVKDILVFSYVNETYFVVQVFGPNGCEKQSASVLQSHTSCCLKEEVPIKDCNQKRCEHRKMPTKASAIVPISLLETSSDEEIVVTNCFKAAIEDTPVSNTDRVSEISGVLSPGLSMEPQFEVLIKKSAVFGRTLRLAVPANFVKLWLPKGNIQIKLLHHKKPGMWPVIARKNGKTLMLQRGWKRFVVSNELHKNDICVFKLVNRVRHIFMVSVMSIRVLNGASTK